MELATLIYAYVFAGFFLLGVLGKVILKALGKYEVTPRDIQLEELLVIPFFAVGYLGMFAYLYDYPILTPMFWQVYFVLLLIQQVASFYMPKLRFLADKVSRGKYLVFVSVGVLVSLPMFYLLYLYAFVSFPSAAA